MNEKEIKGHIKNLKTSKAWLNLTRFEFEIGGEHDELRRECNQTLRSLHRDMTYLRMLIPEEPEEAAIIDNPKPDWMPLMICTIVDLPFGVGMDYTWEELEALVITLSLAGCDGIRIFGTGWGPFIEPFRIMLESGEYSFFKPNPEWDKTLAAFAGLLHKYHMRLYVDLYDNCSHNADWNPFTTTRHKFSHGFYGHTSQIRTNDKEELYLSETDFMIKYWDNRIMACLDPGKDIVGLGNELHCPVEKSAIQCREWAENWGVPRAKNIFAKGFSAPIPFSGAQNTAQKLFGYISAEMHPELGWDYRASCKQVHGLGTMGYVARWAEGGISQRRVFSYDDDGVGTNPDSKVPPSQRGYCEIRRNGSEYACTADTPTRIAAVTEFIDALKNRTYCFSIGFLPREILYKGKTDLSRFDEEISAEIYWKIALKLWGVEIRRSEE